MLQVLYIDISFSDKWLICFSGCSDDDWLNVKIKNWETEIIFLDVRDREARGDEDEVRETKPLHCDHWLTRQGQHDSSWR